ncbi:MAG: hypothetical protein PW792_01290 [Acidobacteriaceae bacterium]|nr:hypothetical protein [Acidobacteriaceae bacterium]
MKRMGASVALFALCFAGSAEAGHPKHVHDDIDPYSGQRILSVAIDTGRCLVETSPDRNPSHVKLLLSAVRQPSAPVEYVLTLSLDGGEWINPGKRGSLQTVIDGKQDELYMVGPKSAWKEWPAFSGTRHKVAKEVIPFGADEEFVKNLAGAKAVQFRINAQNTSLERCTDAVSLRDVHEFLALAATL